MNNQNNENNYNTRKLRKQPGRRNIYTPPDRFWLPTINNEEAIRQIARNYTANKPWAIKKFFNQRRGERILMARTPGIGNRTYKHSYGRNNHNNHNNRNNDNTNNYYGPVRPKASTYVTAPSAASMLQGVRFRTRKNRQRK